MTYVPPQEYLERYARLLVDHALGDHPTEGISPGDVVRVMGADSARPLYYEVCKAVWRSGGHVLHGYRFDDDGERNLTRAFFELASEEQLDFFAEEYWKALMDQSDHSIVLLSDANPHALTDVDPARIMRTRKAQRQLREWQQAKEDAGRFTWTAALYGTEAMAAEAQMSIEDYWGQIIQACYLDEADPLARWREIDEQIQAHCAALNALAIERLHVEGEDADLWLTLGEKRKWVGGGGRNVPSFEIFTTPDWRGTEGWIRFTEPLYAYGSLITGIELQFREGKVISAQADQNQNLLQEMVASEGADRVGEFSMTDARLSRITRFMAHTLYDENVGGQYGNTHLAVGVGLRFAYDGDASLLSEEEWERLGFNSSVIHTDIVQTSDRTVTALLRDGSQQVIYASGQFQHE